VHDEHIARRDHPRQRLAGAAADRVVELAVGRVELRVADPVDQVVQPLGQGDLRTPRERRAQPQAVGDAGGGLQAVDRDAGPDEIEVGLRVQDRGAAVRRVEQRGHVSGRPHVLDDRL
jgi:hypothetical protein